MASSVILVPHEVRFFPESLEKMQRKINSDLETRKQQTERETIM